MQAGSFRFNRNEMAGAFGDIGTFFPLVTALITVNDVELRSVFLAFGFLYIYSGLVFKMPIAVQPMKYIATAMIAYGLPGVLTTYSAFIVSAIFLVLAAKNLVGILNNFIPRSVVRGIQLGLGLNLALLAFNFMREDFLVGWFTSIMGVLLVLFFSRNTRFPPAFALIAIGFGLMILNGPSVKALENIAGSRVSASPIDPLQNTLGLVIPQIPLTIGNAILATALLSKDLFPKNKSVTVYRLTLSHALMNIVSGLLGGIPVCHGAGGLAGHYKFGARSGAAAIIIGVILISIGFLCNEALEQFLFSFPFPILGVFLLFSSLELLKTVKKDFKQMTKTSDIYVTFFVAVLSVGIGYGYVLGVVGGVALAHLIEHVKKQRKRPLFQ